MTRHAPRSRRATSVTISALGAALLTFVAGAKAEVSIEWTGPANCGNAAEVEAEIERLLPDDTGASIHAVVNVTHARVWNATVRLEDAEAVLGERTFEAGSCEELQGAVALLIVLAIDPDAMWAMPEPSDEGGSEEPVETDGRDALVDPLDIDPPTMSEGPVEDAARLGQPSETVSMETAANAPEASEPETEVEPRSGIQEVIEDPHWGVAVRAGLDFGALPAPTPVFSVGAFRQRGRFGLGITVFVALPQDASTTVDASGRLALGAVRATPGLHLRYGRLTLELGGVVELGVMGGRGRDVAGPQTGYSLWTALGAEAGFAIRTGPISLGFRGDIRVPLNRPLYAFRGPLDVHRAASVVARAEIVLGLHFL